MLVPSDNVCLSREISIHQAVNYLEKDNKKIISSTYKEIEIDGGYIKGLDKSQ